MEIIIAGVGAVGYRLAENLSLKHNVYVIDRNSNALNQLQESLDILPIEGDLEDPDTYKELGKRKFDLFIALTNSDEVNILSTLIADDVIEVKRKIIRLKNPYFAKSSLASKIGIDDSIFPYLQTINSLLSLLDYPKANNIKTLPFCEWKLFSIWVEEIEEFNAIPIAFERDGKLYFSQEFKKGDLLYLLAKELPKTSQKIKRVALFGVNSLTLQLAKELKERVELKIVEEDPTLCKKMAKVVQNQATVINSKYIEEKLFTQERLKEADMVITASFDDEKNIVKSLEAKQWGVKKCVTLNNENRYYELIHKLKLIPIRGPKTNAYYEILEKISTSFAIGERHFCGGQGVVLVKKVIKKSRVPKLPKVEGKFLVIRGDEVLSVKPSMSLFPKDIFLLFSFANEDLREWISKI